MRRHATYLVEFYGDEGRGCRDIRKHIAWYLKGFPAGGDPAHARSPSSTRSRPSTGCSPPSTATPRGRASPRRASAAGPGSPRRVVLPEGWLDSRELSAEHAAEVAAAEAHSPGG